MEKKNKKISTYFLQKEAEKRGYVIETICESKNIFFIKNNKKHVLFKGIEGGITSKLARYLSVDKFLTYILLQRNNLPIPECIVIQNNDPQCIKKVKKLGYPLITKPLNGRLGRGVVVNIKNEEELTNAISYTSMFDKNIIVQKFIEGNNLRILVINHRVFAGLERTRHHIIGDGISTIKKLLKKENQNPRRGKNILISTLPKIDINNNLEKFFKIQYGYSFDSCPKKNEKLFLKGNGYAKVIDITDTIPKDIKKTCEQASRVFNLKVVGIDIIYNPSSKGSKHRILEVNSQPGFKTHYLPMEGKPRNVAGAVLDLYFDK